MNQAQRRVLSGSLLTLGGICTLFVVLLTAGSIRSGQFPDDEIVKYWLLLPAGVAFVSVTAGLYIRVGGAR